MSPHHYFAIFLFAINAVTATVASFRNQQVLTVTYPVDFNVTLDVENLTAGSYQKFLTDFRIKLAAQYSGNIPILPYYGTAPPHLFGVLLTTGNHQVTVRGRRDNLYVLGYLMQTTNQWMEFNVDNKGIHMVDPNSKFLDFGDSYADMEKAANAQVTKIYFTKIALQDAVAKLATSTDAKYQAKSLIFMAQMLSEAARFVDVASFFGGHLVKQEYLPEWMRTLENDWSKLSTVVQCYDAYANYVYQKVTINGVVYNTTDQLRSIFGIMLKESAILNPETCGIKKLVDEGEGEAALVLTADI